MGRPMEHIPADSNRRICRKCGKIFNKRSMARHNRICKSKEDTTSLAQDKEVLLGKTLVRTNETSKNYPVENGVCEKPVRSPVRVSTSIESKEFVRLGPRDSTADLQSSTDTSRLPDSVHRNLSILAPSIPIGTLPQFCMFCSASFKKNEDYETHIVKCNPVLSMMTNFAKRKCLICKRSIRHFNVTGLLRHSISCIILDRSKRVNAEEEASAKKKIEAVENELATKNQLKDSNSSPEVPKDEFRPNGLNETVPDAPHSSRNMPSNQTKQITPEKEMVSKDKGYPERVTKILKTFFNGNMFPSAKDLTTLVKSTKLKRTQIQHWFLNARRNNGQDDHGNKVLTSQSASYQEMDIESDSALSNQNDSEDDMEKDSSDSSLGDDGQSRESIQQVKSFSDLPSQLQSIMMAAFKQNPKPAVLDLIHLSQKTGLSTSGVTAWFEKQRKATLSHGYDYSSAVVNEENYDIKEDFEDDVEEKYKPGANIKLMTSRQKLAAIKKITCQEIKRILNDRKPMIVQILLLFASSGSSIQHALEMECMNLAEALENSNTFTTTQLTYFSEWEKDFVIMMYPEKDDQTWIRSVDTFREKILKIWSRVIVFAKFSQCSLDDAAVTILKLTMNRMRNCAENMKISSYYLKLGFNFQNQEDVDVQWEMLHLFRQLEATGVNNCPELSDTADTDSFD